MSDKKRLYREIKRDVKKDGNRSRRRHFKRQLEHNPEEAHCDEYEFKYDTSQVFNGRDHDSKRKMKE